MSEEALQACLGRHLEHAAMVFVLDEELGTRHGLSWADFVLLTMLDAAGGAVPATELARTLCTPASRLLQRLLPLEKIGLVERAVHGDGKRRVMLRPQGRRQLREARETAANACAPYSEIAPYDAVRSKLEIVIHGDRRMVAELHRLVDRLVPGERCQDRSRQVVVSATRNQKSVEFDGCCIFIQHLARLNW